MTKPLRYNDVDPDFPEDLAASHKAVLAVKAWLERTRGYVCVAPEPKPDGEPDEDLLVHIKGVETLWQVKWRRIPFTSNKTFGRATVFVGNVHHYEAWAKMRHPDWIAICNADLSGALIVGKKTRPKWEKVLHIWIPHSGRYQDVYACPVELMKYRSLVE